MSFMRNLYISVIVTCCSASDNNIEQQIREQYSKIADVDKNSLRWVEKSYNQDQNIACIVFKGAVLYVISSVINSNFQLPVNEVNINPNDANVDNVNVTHNLDDQTRFSISMLDILYLYNIDAGAYTVTELASCEDLQRVISERKNQHNRMIIEAIIRHFRNYCTEQKDLLARIQNQEQQDIGKLLGMSINNGVNLPVSNFLKTIHANNAGDQDIDVQAQWSAAITDFLKMIQCYVQDTWWVQNNVKMKSKHQVQHKGMLINEINDINQTIQSVNEHFGRNTVNIATVSTMLSVYLRVYNIVAGNHQGINGQNNAKTSYKTVKEIFSNITHTEQIIDWLSKKYDEQIQFLFNGKTPCNKCAEYITYCEDAYNLWKNRVNIGCNYGWRQNNEAFYLISTKVFNAKTNDDRICSKILTPGNQNDSSYSYEECNSEQCTDNIKCYAIGDYRELEWTQYNGQLMMKQDTSVIQNYINCEADVPILGKIENNLSTTNVDTYIHSTEVEVLTEETNVQTKDVILLDDITDQFRSWGDKIAQNNANIANRIRDNHVKVQNWFNSKCNVE